MPALVAATSPWMRLRGLAFRDEAWLAGRALLLPRTRSVHTFGMRFAIDLLWVDRQGRVIRVDRAVPPRRLRSCRQARAVVEVPAGGAGAWAQSAGTLEAVGPDEHLGDRVEQIRRDLLGQLEP